MKPLFSFLLVAALFTTSACVSNQASSMDNAEGNTFNIMSGDVRGEHFVTVQRQGPTWLGELQGDKEKLEARKSLLMKLAKKQADQLCNGNSIFTEYTEFTMIDNNPAWYGGGLLGYAIASADSEYKNLPAGLTGYRYRCPNEPAQSNEPR